MTQECGVCASLATPHSTRGELYHGPSVQTKHTAPNKDDTVLRAAPVQPKQHMAELVPQTTRRDLHSSMRRAHFLIGPSVCAFVFFFGGKINFALFVAK